MLFITVRDAPGELHHGHLRKIATAHDPVALANQAAPKQRLVSLRRLFRRLAETSGIVASLRRHRRLILEPRTELRTNIL